MSDHITVAVDGMGGDSAPEVVIGGIETTCRADSKVKFLLFGNKEKIGPLLSRSHYAQELCELIHTDEEVTNDDKPTFALRNRTKSSMRLAIDAVKEHKADAVISAGNTGALMAMATIVLKTLPGISRPAIASSFPTQAGDSVMLDLGANVECDSNNLVQFAVMGEVYARNELGLSQPSVGILNVGVEGLKGNDSVRDAAAILKNSNLPLEFYGFIEGDDIGKGTVDVIVTDGFTGNIALKTAEGTAQMIAYFLKDALKSSILSKAGALLARPAIEKVRSHFDPRRYNGALLLGLNGICVKSHGGTDEVGFAHAIQVGVNLVRRDLNDLIKEDIASVMIEPSQSIIE
ncbi:MAG: Phosphate acyltransferase [Alphaproteobacteria bacterium MarineAlpha3_Bin7]|nr:MAG: Phosphate acyltransferase [Alphaproteobacteria bacterium MarineAlpha3_Bin7]